MTDDPDIAGIVSELLAGVSSDHPAEQGVVFGQLIVRLLDAGLYKACDDGSLVAAGVNEALSGLAAVYGTGVVWQLVRVKLPALDRPGATGGPPPLH